MGLIGPVFSLGFTFFVINLYKKRGGSIWTKTKTNLIAR